MCIRPASKVQHCRMNYSTGPSPLQLFVGEAVQAGAPVPLELYPEDQVVQVAKVPRGQLVHWLRGTGD